MKPLELHWPEGLSTEHFLRDYWQQKPLLMPQAFPDFSSPLTPDELGGLALEPDIHSRIILLERAKEPDADDTWHLRTGPFTEDELTQLPAHDWTLLVSDIEKHLDGFSAYLEPFRFLPDWRIDDLMISYAPTGASAGAHIDEYDVFLFQAAGQRRWQISTDQSAPTDILADQDLKILQQFDATETWTLSAGDILYLPPGIPHHGIAQDNDCMTWSIGFRAPMEQQLLADITEQLLTYSPSRRYRDPALVPINRKGELDTNSLDNLEQLWQQVTSPAKEMFIRATGCVLTRRQDSLNDTLAQDQADSLPSVGQVQRHGAARLLFVTTDAGSELFANGEHYRVSKSLAEMLCARSEWSVTELLALCHDPADNRLLDTLWQQGVLLQVDQDT